MSKNIRAPGLKSALIAKMEQNYAGAMQFYSLSKKIMGDDWRPARVRTPAGNIVTQDELEDDITTFAVTRQNVLPCQTILFSVEQCEVFWELIDKGSMPTLEYKLPFQDVLLEFTLPMTVTSPEGRRAVTGMVLNQIEVDRETFEKNTATVLGADAQFGYVSETRIIPIDWEKSDTVIVNRVTFVDTDFFVETMAWTSQADYAEIDDRVPEDLLDWRMKFKAIAIACIGYINCENVYLERIQQASESVNAKRERKGKSRLEPYYICRIRGIQYDSTDPTGTGTKHGIRYDVRGHFRRLQTGKTIWVRPHQRGLQNELYVPKTYLVDRRVAQ